MYVSHDAHMMCKEEGSFTWCVHDAGDSAWCAYGEGSGRVLYMVLQAPEETIKFVQERDSESSRCV